MRRELEIHPLRPRDFPRPSRFPSGNILGVGKSLKHWGWISQYLPHFGGAQIHFYHTEMEDPGKRHVNESNPILL